LFPLRQNERMGTYKCHLSWCTAIIVSPLVYSYIYTLSNQRIVFFRMIACSILSVYNSTMSWTKSKQQTNNSQVSFMTVCYRMHKDFFVLCWFNIKDKIVTACMFSDTRSSESTHIKKCIYIRIWALHENKCI